MKTTEQILRDARLLSTFWGRRIMAARKRNRFTEKDKKHAAFWQTCACGRLTQNIPRNFNGRPYDRDLFKLGCDFCDHVTASRTKQAALTLVDIEKRAQQIVSEGHPAKEPA